MTIHRSWGLTLVELLTSVTIGLALSVLATSSFLKVRAVLRREQVRVEMHNSARLLYQALREHLSAMQQDGALYLETTADANPTASLFDLSHTGNVSLTFLKGKMDSRDFTTGQGYGAYINEASDLVWCQWRFDQKHSSICTGISSGPHDWQCNASWPGPIGDYSGRRFRNMPQPRRLAGASASSALDDNRFGSPDFRDIGDYTDLSNNLGPVIRNVTSFTIELIYADGSVQNGDVLQTRSFPIDGCLVDASTTVSVGQPQRKRPRLIRVRFEITDPVLNFSQAFSFSFQAPNTLPATYP